MTKHIQFFVLLGLLIHASNSFSESIYFNVKEFGAIGNGVAIETAHLQRAIDSCYRKGGGTVFFPAGEYLSATLQLKDCVTLYLEAGARLIASDCKDLYTVKVNIADTGSKSTPMLIYANEAKNISIKGEGEIMAQPKYDKYPLAFSDFISDDIAVAKAANIEMMTWRWREPNVTLVHLSNCKDVQVSGVRLLHSAFWTLHIHRCERVNIHGIYIYSDLEKGVNADGIDIDGCKNVTISDCVIETADDAICMKTTQDSTGYKDCENVIVSNCILTSSSCALKLGTESYGDFRYITFSNCIIRNTNRGFGIFIRDGGIAENIVFSNIQMECTRKPVGWWGSADAFRFIVMKRNKLSKVGCIKNVKLESVNAKVEGTSLIAGYNSTQNIEGIILDEVHISMNPEMALDKRAKEGIVIQNAKRITLQETEIIWNGKNENWTYNYYLHNVLDVSFNKVIFHSINEYPPLYIQNCDNIWLQQGKFDTPQNICIRKENVGNLIIDESNIYQ